MYHDTTLQEAASRGIKCHGNDMSKSCKFVRLIAKYLREDYNSVFHGKAQNLGRVLCKAYDEALQKYDVLILPTLPKKAPVFPKENPSFEGQTLPCLHVDRCSYILIRGGLGIFPQVLFRNLSPDPAHGKLGLNQVIFSRVTINNQVLATINSCRCLVMFQVTQK